MLKTDGESAVRDNLAQLRTQMANERTLLAYLRTALMLLATGGTVLKLLADTLLLHLVGWILIAMGAAISIWGIQRYHHYKKQYRSSEQP